MLYVSRLMIAARNDDPRLSACPCSWVVPTCRIANTEVLIRKTRVENRFRHFARKSIRGVVEADSPLGQCIPAEILT